MRASSTIAMSERSVVQMAASVLSAVVFLGSTSVQIAIATDEPVVIRENSFFQEVRWSVDGRLIAIVGTNDKWPFYHTVKLWNTRTGELVRDYSDDEDNQSAIAVSRDFLAVAINGKSGMLSVGSKEIRLLDLSSGELRQRFDKQDMPGVSLWTSLAFSRDGTRLALTGYGKASGFGGPFIKILHIDADRWIGTEAEYLPPALVPPQEEQLLFFRSAEFSPDTSLVAVGTDDSRIHLFSGHTGKLVTTLQVDPDNRDQTIDVGTVAFSPDGRTLASPGTDNTTLLWDLTERKPRTVLKGHHEPVSSIAWAADRRRLATGSHASRQGKPGRLLLWDPGTAKLQQEISDLPLPVNALRFSPDSTRLAICMGFARDEGDGTWNVRGETRIVTLKPPDSR